MKCIDENISIRGDYSTPSAQRLFLQFEKCDSSKDSNNCKSDIEITNWLKQKLIVI